MSCSILLFMWFSLHLDHKNDVYRLAASVQCHLESLPLSFIPFFCITLRNVLQADAAHLAWVSAECLLLPTLCVWTSDRLNLLEPLNVRAGSCTSFPALMWVLHTRAHTLTHTYKLKWQTRRVETPWQQNQKWKKMHFISYHLKKGSF